MSKLETSNLCVGYEKNILIDDINLKFESGQIVVLIGPNGSGKSTILKTITKQLKILGGSISILGKELKDQKEIEIAKQLSMVTTERINPEKMTCRDVIATGRYPYTGIFGFLTEKDNKSIDEAITLVHAEEISNRDFCKISDGQRQRIMLARAVCQSTDIIVLDEPTSFLDMHFKLDLLKIIWKLAKEKNKLIIMSLHELELVKEIADYIICVDGKKVVKCGTPLDIFSFGFIQKLYGLEPEEFNEKTCMMQFYRKKSLVKKISDTSEQNKESTHHAKIIMVQGTMSNAGKSFLVAGLCRIFKQDGFRAAPFKSQNMALNSFITKDGLEMGRAQVMQAEACGMEPEVCMNPILLKPTNDKGSQVIVNGEVLGNMNARDYFEYKNNLVPEIIKAFKKLEEKADIIVIEGAGSPAEINLRKNDIVNMGLAEILDAPVLLTGDIDRGGVFAQLVGTLELLPLNERARVKGLIINKFRGDKSILEPGIEMLVQKCGIPVTGVVPYMKVLLDDEDSLSSCFDLQKFNRINIGVVQLPRISNFTDFSVFNQFEEVSLHYLKGTSEACSLVEKMDMIIIPGSKNTIGDLKWLRECGLEASIKKFAFDGKPVFGICGGYQMLGKFILDPGYVEEGGAIRGMELLDVETTLEKEKTRLQCHGEIKNFSGIFYGLNGRMFTGYEIHMGKTKIGKDAVVINNGACSGNIYGTYIHGFFDDDEIAFLVCKALADKKGIDFIKHGHTSKKYNDFKQEQYDILAETLRAHLNMDEIYRILKPAKIKEVEN